MNYIKTTVILPVDKKLLTGAVLNKVLSLRELLFKLGCFDIDWLNPKSVTIHYRPSDLVIDLTGMSKLAAYARKTKSSYFTLNLAEQNKLTVEFINELTVEVRKRYKFPSIISELKLPSLYHISLNGDLPIKMVPRQPEGNSSEIMGEEIPDPKTEELLPNRVSFSSSIEGCFRAIYPNILETVKVSKGRPIQFTVYGLTPTAKTKFMGPDELTDKEKVHDACFTMEHVFFKTVYVRKIAQILIHVNKNPREDMITYRMFGGVVEGDDTGWAPDIYYEVKKLYTAAFLDLQKYDLNIKGTP